MSDLESRMLMLGKLFDVDKKQSVPDYTPVLIVIAIGFIIYLLERDKVKVQYIPYPMPQKNYYNNPMKQLNSIEMLGYM